MSKLHEILAVEKNSETAARKLMAESAKTLEKENLFSGFVKNLDMFDDDQKYLNVTEKQNLESTVDENLDYLNIFIGKYWDLVATKEVANQTAKADIIVGDVTLAKDLPATFLLGMETKLNELRKVYEHIPTLAPGIKWIKDEANEKHNVFMTADDQVSFKTQKESAFVVAYEATEHHPAQVYKEEKTVNTGKYTMVKFSGMLPAVEKARRIENIDTLIRAVKKARMRANDIEVEKIKVAKQLLNFINS